MSRRPYNILDVKDALAVLYSQGITSIHYDDFLELFCEKRGVEMERELDAIPKSIQKHKEVQRENAKKREAGKRKSEGMFIPIDKYEEFQEFQEFKKWKKNGGMMHEV